MLSNFTSSKKQRNCIASDVKKYCKQNYSVKKTKQNRLMLASNCAVCGMKK